MTDETEKGVSGWTVETLHLWTISMLAGRDREANQLRLMLQERFEAQTRAVDAAFIAQEHAMESALSAAEKATAKAEMASERRFESVNEFRGQLRDQAGTLMPRSEAEARLNDLADKVENRTVANADKISEAMRDMIPRLEAKLLIDASGVRIESLSTSMSSRLDSLATSVTSLSSSLAAIRAGAAGQSAGAEEQIEALVRNRNLIFAIIGVFFTVIVIAISLYFGVHHDNTNNNPTVSTTVPAETSSTQP